MKLSMSMIAWYLQDHHPICQIEDDDMTIGGLRFVLDDVLDLQPEYVYFGAANHFFYSSQYEGAYLAVNRRSMLIFLHSDYNMLLNAVLSAFEFFNRMEGRLLQAASSNAPLQVFLNIMEPVLENPLLIQDLDGRFGLMTELDGHQVDPVWAQLPAAGMASHPGFYAPYFDDTGERIRDLSERPIIVRNVYAGGAPVVMLYLQQGGETVGTMAILQENETLLRQNIQLAPIFARYCVRAEEFTTATGTLQTRSLVFQNLLEGREVGKINIKKMEAALPSDLWRLIAVRLVDRTDRLAKRAMLHNLRTHPELYLPLEIGEMQYALLSESVYQKCRRGTCVALTLQGAGVGVSMPFSDLNTMAVRRRQAEFALEQSGGEMGVFSCETYACSYLLQTFRALEETASLLHPALEQLERYDRNNQGELRKTLAAYLDREQNHLATSKALHIHPNTLRYRLQRITELTDLRLDDGEDLKYLRLSLWLAE